MALPPDTNVNYNTYPTKSGMGKFYLARIGKKVTGSAPLTKRFETETAARRWIMDSVATFEERLRVHGENSAVLTPQQYSAAVVATNLLGEAPNVLADLGNLWVSIGKPSAAQMRGFMDGLKYLGKEPWSALNHALAFFKKYSPPPTDQKTVADVCNYWLAVKTGKAQLLVFGTGSASLDKRTKTGANDYVRGMRSSLKKLVTAFGDRHFHTLTAPELQKWLWSLPYKNNSLRHLAKDYHTIWEWAISKLECGKVNPWPSVTTPDKDPIKIGILSTHDCFLLLKAAITPEFISLLPGLVCCLFAGVRPKECQRLRWEHIRLGTRRPIINLTADVAKTRHRRVIHLSANAVLWLSLVPESKRVGKVKAGDWTHLFPKLRRKAGVTSFSRNCLRHSFASYHASVYGEVKTAEQLGHTNLGTIKSHYQENVLPEEADVFWAITPKSTWKAMEKILRAA